MERETIMIAAGTKKKIAKMANKVGLSTDKLVEVLLESFVEGKGNIFVGNWKEGPGIRLLPDWPRFSSGVVKIKRDEMR